MEKGTFEKKPLHVKAYPLEGPHTVTYRGKEIQGGVGDWLVYDIEGNPYLISDDHFRATYKPIDEIATKQFSEKK